MGQKSRLRVPTLGFDSLGSPTFCLSSFNTSVSLQELPRTKLPPQDKVGSLALPPKVAPNFAGPRLQSCWLQVSRTGEGGFFLHIARKKPGEPGAEACETTAASDQHLRGPILFPLCASPSRLAPGAWLRSFEEAYPGLIPGRESGGLRAMQAQVTQGATTGVRFRVGLRF